MASAKPGSSTYRQSDVYGTDTLRFIMVGMTGTGKSALGNSMLAWGYLKLGEIWTKLTRPFISQTSSESVTVNCKEFNAEILGRKVSIVDTPGFFDTKISVDKTVEELTKSVLLVQPGPHAILLVVKVGRFTKEVVDGIDQMKKIFGEKSIKFLIIVFTHIDSLNDDETLEQFVDTMTGSPRQLVNDCKKRYVGFNNKFKPTSPENRQQVGDLLEMAEEIRRANNGNCYTNELLKEAQEIMKKEKDVKKAVASPAGQNMQKNIKKKSGGCFASDSMVRVQDNIGRTTLKYLEDLAVGDLVESYDPESNSVTYSPIYYIIYQDDNDRKSVLRELFYHGSDGKVRSLRLQGKHLVYATIHTPSASLDTCIPPPTPIMSEKVNIGDVLWIIDDDSGELCPRLVTKIGELVANVRHPMTMNHTIIVDGVLASVHMHNEWFLRQATVPLRLLYKISPRLSGLWIPKKAVQGWDYVERFLLE